MELIVGGKYELHTKLGEGSYGQLFSGQNIKTKVMVAIKLELLTCEDP